VAGLPFLAQDLDFRIFFGQAGIPLFFPQQPKCLLRQLLR
jgi:hypothetical protein